MGHLPRSRPARLLTTIGLIVTMVVSVPTTAQAATPIDLGPYGTVTASAAQNDGDGNFPASNLTDGDETTRWASGNGPDDPAADFSATLTSDLGASAALTGVRLNWEAAYAIAYTVSIADTEPADAASWTAVNTTVDGDGGVDEISFDTPVDARYVRVEMTQRVAFTWDPNQLHYYGYSMYSLNILGTYDIAQTAVFAADTLVPAGDDVTVSVELTGATETDQSVRVSTVDGTAAAGVDYTALDETLTFTAGETTKDIVIPTVSQGTLAGNRTFTVTLSDTSAGLALSSRSQVTVTLTPTGAQIDVGDSVVLEGFENGVPSTYAGWGADASATPVLTTAPDATRPGSAADNHTLVATVGADAAWYGFTYEERNGNVSTVFDWSDYDGFSFAFLGQGSGKTFAFELHNRTSSDQEQGFETAVTDDSVGWRKVSVLFADLTPKGGVSTDFNPAAATGFAITLSGMGAGAYVFDDFALDTRAVLLDDFENGISGDPGAGLGYFTWGSDGAVVTIGTVQQERAGNTDNHVIGGTYQIPAGGFGGFSDQLGQSQDWSSFRGIRFWWYASQANNPASPSAGGDIRVEIKDGGPNANVAENWVATFKDNWSTAGSRWKLVSLPFSDFQISGYQPGSAETQDGVLSLTSEWGYAVTLVPGTAAPTGWAMDDVQLYGTPAAADQLAVVTDQDVYLVDPGGTATVGVTVTTPDGEPLAAPVEVNWSTGNDGSAQDGVDYSAAAGTLTFAAGTESGTAQTVEIVTTAGTSAAESLSIPLILSSAATVPAVAPRVVINAHDLPYLDTTLSIDDRVTDLIGRMTTAQKAGQMAQAERLGLSTPAQIAELGLGSVLSGGGSTPAANTPEAWAAMIDDFQRQALSTPLQIPLLYGVDSVHGHSNVKDATIYPHNIGLGATRDPELVRQIAEQTASETRTTGANWAFAPCLCVSRDERWGRTYESFGEDPALVTTFAQATVIGLQGTDPTDISGPGEVLATAKHWAGDGDTSYDDALSGTGQYPIDQGITEVPSWDIFERLSAAPYVPAVAAGVGSIMPSYSAVSVDGGEALRMTEQPINQTMLKDTMGFDGFLISDWQAIDKLPEGSYYDKVIRAVNGGSLDMAMAPYNFGEFITAIETAAGNGDITMDRIDDAVRRILTAKFDMGLFENAFTDSSERDQFGGAEHRATAAQAAAQSQVLLKNDAAALPLAKTGKLYVAGSNANDLGNQMGGWTISWQGGSGNGMTTGTTILDGIQQLAPDLQITYSATASEDLTGYDAGLVVVGETPYAEGQGDVGNNGHTLDLSTTDTAAVEKVCAAVPTCVVLVISGRPVLLSGIADQADAIVAGFLPGSEGEGVASVLLGDTPFTGRLPLTWPRSADQLPINVGDESYDPAWAYGWGLRTDAARDRLVALVGGLDGDAAARVQALIDADVWASDGSLTDVTAAMPLLAGAAAGLTQVDTVEPIGVSIDQALTNPIDVDRVTDADVVVSVARDAAQAAVVAQGATPDPADLAAIADAEHLVMSGDAWSAVQKLAAVAGVLTYIPDTTAPVLSVSTTPATPTGQNGWYTGTVTVAATAYDPEVDGALFSGLATVQYSVDGGAWVDGTSVSAPVGVSTIAFRAIDGVGNTTTESVTVKRDPSAPTVTASQARNGSGVAVTLRARDAASGVASIRYTLDGKGIGTYTTPIQVNGKGFHVLVYTAVDVAGNLRFPQIALVVVR